MLKNPKAQIPMIDKLKMQNEKRKATT
jgi:hypothetical protein